MIKLLATIGTRHAAMGGGHYSGNEIFLSFVFALSVLTITMLFLILGYKILRIKLTDEYMAALVSGIISTVFVVLIILGFQTIMLGKFPWNV